MREKITAHTARIASPRTLYLTKVFSEISAADSTDAAPNRVGTLTLNRRGAAEEKGQRIKCGPLRASAVYTHSDRGLR
jgi:hypothetical protein